jgi:hypothetical protein
MVLEPEELDDEEEEELRDGADAAVYACTKF